MSEKCQGCNADLDTDSIPHGMCAECDGVSVTCTQCDEMVDVDDMASGICTQCRNSNQEFEFNQSDQEFWEAQ